MTPALFDDGVDLTRQRLRRESPEADEGEIRDRIIAWLQGGQVLDPDGALVETRRWTAPC